jgi:hypothetical protein
MANSIKYESIQDVFTHHYEALSKWRGYICLPHLMPDAVRYYIAQQLIDAALVESLDVHRPDQTGLPLLRFADGSILRIPDYLFDDEDGYDAVLLEKEIRERINKNERNIRSLIFETKADELVKKALRIRNAIARMYPKSSYLVKTGMQKLMNKLNRTLVNIFCQGRCHVSHDRELCDIAKRAEELMRRLAPSMELRASIAIWLANEMELLDSSQIRKRQPTQQNAYNLK